MLFGQKKIQPEHITAEFFKNYEKDPADAYEKLSMSNKYPNVDAIHQQKKTISEYLGQLGKYNGFEEVSTKAISPSLLIDTFLVKYDRQPVRFTFMLYNPDGTWTLSHFSFENISQDEIREVAKWSRLP